jgi:hypothetical protein
MDTQVVLMAKQKDKGEKKTTKHHVIVFFQQSESFEVESHAPLAGVS